MKDDKFDDQDDLDWQHERAIEAGMLHGIEAYNDMMGYSSEPVIDDEELIDDVYTDDEYLEEDRTDEDE